MGALTNNLSVAADKGITGTSSIYKSMYIYDMRTKRYEGKITGLYIIPARAHEFKLLNDEQLMGLSENRNLFYIWSIKDGKFKSVSMSYFMSGATSTTQNVFFVVFSADY